MYVLRVLSVVSVLFGVVQVAEAGKPKKPKGGPPTPAPPPSAPIPLPCDWPAGTTFAYTLERDRTDTRNPALASVHTTTPIAVTVTAPGDPLAVDYLVGEPSIEGPEEAIGPLKAMVQGAPAIPMKLVLKDGLLAELTNHLALVDATEPVLRKAAQGGPPDVVEKTLSMMRDPELGPRLMMKEPAMFFALHCLALAEGQVVEVPTAQPNPFGGPPLAGVSRVELTRHDAAAGTVTVETRDAMDPSALQAMVPALLARFAPPEAVADPAMVEKILAQLPPIASVTTGTAVYSTADGFPVSLRYHVEIGADGHPMRKTDTWTWTRTAP